jgi:hypothetical protein
MEGVVGPTWQVDFSVHLYPPLLLGGGGCVSTHSSATPVGGSDACKVEPDRGS